MNAIHYLLTCVIEECAEVSQRATKAMRFGLHEVQPGQDLNNLERLAGELNDLMAVIDLLQALEGPEYLEFDDEKIRIKQEKILQFASYSVEQGTLDIAAYQELKELIELEEEA